MTRGRAGTICLLPSLLAALACGPSTSGLPAEQLWSQHCQSCHGADGRGVPARRGLEPALDLKRSQLLEGRGRNLGYQRVAYGYGAMPGFVHKLPQGDLELLVQHAASLAKR